MFLQSKLISQKVKKFRNLIFILLAIGILSWIMSYAITNSCDIKHITILSDIQKYENSLDPELCESLVEQILDFNDECDSYIEIMDCG